VTVRAEWKSDPSQEGCGALNFRMSHIRIGQDSGRRCLDIDGLSNYKNFYKNFLIKPFERPKCFGGIKVS